MEEENRMPDSSAQEIEVEGIKVPTNLPKPSPGRDLKKAEKIEIATYLCMIHSKDKFNLAETLKLFGIKDYGTWHRWVRKIPEIQALYKEAENNRTVEYFKRLKAKARTALERKIEGEYLVLKTRKVKRPSKEDKTTHPQLASVELLVEETEKEVYIQPDSQAIIFALTNMDSVNFEKSPKPEDPEEGEINIPPISWVE
ncbi:MAG: hypothetical protein ACJA01_003083 [Saprospiraceae bacterium]|jgi:hypothetical protein